MRILNNYGKYIFLFIIIILPSIFNCEHFMFIRYYALLNLSGWLLIYFAERERKINIYAISVFLLYIIIFTIHYNYSVNPYNSRLHFAEYAVYFTALVFISSIEWKKTRIFYTIASALSLSAVIQVFYSLPQIISGMNRIEGNTSYPNFLSLLLIGGITALIFISIRIFKLNRKSLFLTIPLTLLLFFFLVKTGSRNIIVLIPFVAFFIVFTFKKRFSLIMLFVILILMLIIPSKSKNRMFHEAEINPYGVQRINIYKQAVNIGIDNLPFGIGYGNFHYYSLKNNFPVEGRIGRYAAHAKIAHNEYLEWFVNAGILGIILLISFLLIVIRYIYKKKKISLEDKFINEMSSSFVFFSN